MRPTCSYFIVTNDSVAASCMTVSTFYEVRVLWRVLIARDGAFSSVRTLRTHC